MSQERENSRSKLKDVATKWHSCNREITRVLVPITLQSNQDLFANRDRPVDQHNGTTLFSPCIPHHSARNAAENWISLLLLVWHLSRSNEIRSIDGNPSERRPSSSSFYNLKIERREASLQRILTVIKELNCSISPEERTSVRRNRRKIERGDDG